MCEKDKDTIFLNLAALCDAYHDFKKDYFKELRKNIHKYKDTILDSLKCPSKIPDETYEIYNNPEGSLLKGYIGFDIMELINKLKNEKGMRITYNLRKLGNNYQIKLFHKDSNTDIRKISITEKLFSNYIDSNNVNLLYDTGTINILDILDKMKKSTLNVNQIINREVVNDSAINKQFSELDNIQKLYDVTKSQIIYDKESKFNTKYTLSLSCPYLVNGKLGTKFEIKDEGKLLYESKSGEENDSTHCFENLRKKYENKADVIFQVKRSGDWLQALSCLDTTREYKDLSIEYENIITLDNIILITNDKILLVYSLFLGIDVFYTVASGTSDDRKTELIYFKSLSRQISKASPTTAPPVESTSSSVLKHNYNEVELQNKIVEERQRQNKIVEEDQRQYKIVEEELDNLKKSEEKNMVINLTYDEKFGADYILDYIKAKKAKKDIDIVSYFRDRGLLNPKQSGGDKSNLKKYVAELLDSIKEFHTDENPDYEYYEAAALIFLACAHIYKGEPDFLQYIAFDILPSVEGYIKTERDDVKQFFGDDYTADCTSFAARNIALHSIGLWSGPIGSKEKIDRNIEPTAVDEYKKIKGALPEAFEERQEIIINKLQNLLEESGTPPRAGPSTPIRNSTRKRARSHSINNNSNNKHTQKVKRYKSNRSRRTSRSGVSHATQRAKSLGH